MLTESSQQAIEPRRGGWLRERRNRLALWIALAEGILVAVSQDVTKWAVAGLAALAVVVWVFGRHMGSSTVRHVLWIFAVSQLLALVLVFFAVFFKWLLILGLIAVAVIALAFLFLDRR